MGTIPDQKKKYWLNLKSACSVRKYSLMFEKIFEEKLHLYSCSGQKGNETAQERVKGGKRNVWEAQG